MMVTGVVRGNATRTTARPPGRGTLCDV